MRRFMANYAAAIFSGLALLRSGVWLFSLILCSGAAAANVSDLAGNLAKANWGGCPAVTSSGLQIQGLPLALNIKQLDLDIACLLEQGSSASQAGGFKLSQWQAPIQQMFQQLQRSPLSLAATSVGVEQLNIVNGGQLLFRGELKLVQQAQQWQANFQSKGEFALTLKVMPKQETLALSAKLSANSLTTLATLTQQSWLADPRLAEMKLAMSGNVGKQLALSFDIQLPAYPASLKGQLAGWQAWRVTASSSALLVSDTRVPEARWQLEQNQWQVHVADWSLDGRGEWQLSPQLTLGGHLRTHNLLPLQQALVDLPAPLNLLSAQAACSFDWDIDTFESQFTLDGINAIWDELIFENGSLSGHISHQAEIGWMHQGTVKLAQWDIGIPLSQLSLDWRQTHAATLSQWSSVQLENIGFSVLGGSGNIVQLPLTLPSEASLQLQGVQLPELVALYPELELSMQGSVSGDLPLHISEQGLRIAGGNLAVVEPQGHIALTHQSLVSVKAQHPSLDFALSLLEDFNYEKLAAQLDFAEDGQLDMQVKLIGRNQHVSPSLVTVNYSHQENIYQLLRSLRIGEQLSGQLQQWIDETSLLAEPSP
ncbi:intermembrane phospholipid transport protein YdbH family protein [Agarivorans sp. MS3-6]